MSTLKPNAGTPFDQITGGVIQPTPAPAPAGTPSTFTELLSGATETSVCPCGDPATVHLGMQARPAIERGKGGKGTGIAAAIAKHSVRLCEPCAVRLFDKFRRDSR